MTAPVQAGEVLAGKYRVERVLGVGGMGVVVAATHLQLDQLVALKFMLPEVAKDAGHVSRFLREARAVVRLKGEHVARVSDVGTLENGAPYIVMEYLEGEDLAGTLERRGPLPLGDACGYVLQACEAMAEAHVLGIVHRDLKPQNLFLTQRPDGMPVVKVLDFGISKTNLSEARGFDATHTSAMMGSPAYMSPEQIRSAKEVDARTDIWALGVILHQLVSGQLPFAASTVVELCVQVLHKDAAPLTNVPPELAAVIARCLAKDRDQRYANLAELVNDLAPFVPRAGAETVERVSRLLRVPPRASASMDLPAPPAVARTRPTVETTLGGAASSVVGASSAPRRPARWVAPLAIGGVLVLGTTVFVTTRSSSRPVATQPSIDALQVTATADAAPPDATPPSDAAAIATPSIDAAAPTVAAKKPPRVQQPPKLDPRTVEPPKVLPAKVDPPRVDPPKVDPPKVDPPKLDPPKRDPFGSRH